MAMARLMRFPSWPAVLMRSLTGFVLGESIMIFTLPIRKIKRWVTSTGDAPGINRIELYGDRGRLLAENGKLTFYKLAESLQEYNFSTKEGFKSPAYEAVDVPLEGEFQWHPYILNNFCAAILRDEPLYIPGDEGIKGLTLSNAIMLSSWLDATIELPLDEDRFYTELMKRVETSSFSGKY